MIVHTAKQFDTFFSRLYNARFYVYDTETTGLRPFHGNVINGMAFGLVREDKNLDTFYLPFRHQGNKNLAGGVFEKLAGVFADPDKTMLAFNGKFDIHFTQMAGMPVHNQFLDTMLAFHLFNENLGDYRLKSLGHRYLGAESVQASGELDKLLETRGLHKGQMEHLTAEEVCTYAEGDVILTYELLRAVLPNLKSQGLYEIFKEVCAYSKVIGSCEYRGVYIDVEGATANVEIASEECRSALAQLRELLGYDINPNSHVQVKKALNLFCSDRDHLEALMGVDTKESHVAEQILRYRGWAKTVGSFLRPFLELRDDRGCFHPNFKLHGTVSGRLSCGAEDKKIAPSVNLQALSRKDEDRPWTLGVRAAISAAPGNVLISSDFSQAELRLLAHYTGDTLLMDAFAGAEQGDIHQMVAEMIGIDRYYAKRINFGMVYGMGVKEGVIQLHRPEKEVKAILGKYNSTIPGIRQLYTEMESIARNRKYIEMWTGRRRRYNALNKGYHKAMSALIQGGQAEIMRVVMTRLAPELKHGWMVLQVHDDILVECPPEHALAEAATIRRVMTDLNFRVPFLVDQKIGPSWGNMTKVEK